MPAPAEAGRIEQRVAPPPAPSRRIELPQIEGAPAGEAPEALKGVRMVLREVRVEDASAIPQERFQALAAPYLGREVTGADLFELARRMTALYRSRGYLLSLVVVPPQTISDGRLRLRAVEGYVANVVVEGDLGVQARLAELGEKIRASRPLKAEVLERYLLIANDLAGVRVRSVLTPSRTPGAADLRLVAEVKKLEGYVSLDNYGSKYLGPGQLGLGIAGNQLFAADQLRFTGVTTGNGELAYGQLAYSALVGAEGMKLGGSVSQARTQPGDVLEPFEVRGKANAAMLSAAYPFLRTRNDSLLGRAVLDRRDIDTDLLGTRLIEDRIRALRVGLTWLSLDRLDGQNTLDLELSQGLGGTRQEDPLKSRLGADGRFRKAVLDYERVQPLGASWLLTLGAAAQWTDEPLLSSEEYALGGRRFGRAYEPAELVGDRALAFRAEPAYVVRSAGWVKAWQAYAFYDLGKVWYRDDPAFGANRPGQSLASAGLGARVALGANATASLEAAAPLTRPVASYQASGAGNHVRVLGSIVVRF